MISILFKRLYKELAASSIREITAHMMDNILGGFMTLLFTHQITITIVMQLGFIGILLIIVVILVKDRDEEQPEQPKGKESTHDYSI